MAKLLVTHINPHMDDIAAIWLFKRFNPEFSDAQIKFLPTAIEAVTWEGKPADSDPDVIHFGIGRGRYDEHKGDINDCATSLVWRDVKDKAEGLEKAALQEIVDWETLDDTGRLSQGEYPEFSIPAWIRPKDATKIESSYEAMKLGSEILDRLLQVLVRKQQSLKDWESRVEFQSIFGKAVAVVSETVDRGFCKQNPGEVFLMKDPKKGYAQFFTPSQTIDLEPLYEKLKELEPQVGWYLHQSHHLVICGSNSSPNEEKSKLSLGELIEVVKNL